MILTRPAVLALAAACAVALAMPARAEGPKPWTPKSPGSQGVSAPAPAAAYDTLRTPPSDRPLPTPAGVTRSLDLRYEPSVPDSLLPLVPLYREIKTDETLSVYLGALRQDLPVRPYPVVEDGQTVHATVDGLDGQSHLAIVLMVPWFGDILPKPYALGSLVVKVDDAPELKSKLMFTPGPVIYVPGQRPLPVSNPTLVTIPLAPGRHRVQVKLKGLEAAYAFLLLGQPRLTPPAIERAR
ncbi:MAG: hypothetical protein ABI960_03505 [Candidatus Eisenbacteria bacterium]